MVTLRELQKSGFVVGDEAIVSLEGAICLTKLQTEKNCFSVYPGDRVRLEKQLSGNDTNIISLTCGAKRQVFAIRSIDGLFWGNYFSNNRLIHI